jgi:adenylate kinase
MIICVTGTPGTGKTTLAKSIAKKRLGEYISGNDIIEKYLLSEGYDQKRDCNIIDPDKFTKKALIECKNEKKKYILDSHLSHNLPKRKVALCIVCKCELKKLKKRLEKREYSQNKIRENIDSEIFDICLNEAVEKGHQIAIYDGKNKDKIIKKVKQIFEK